MTNAGGDALEPRIAWIFGSTRSGSTWLLRLLCHPLILETAGDLGFSLPEGAPSGRPVDVLPVNELLLGQHLKPRIGSAKELPDGGYGWLTTDRFWSSSPNYVLSRHFEDGWRPALRDLVLARLQAMVERAESRFAVRDAPLVVVKDVGMSHAADATMALLPRSRFLFLVRDGRDVLDSLIHAGKEGAWFARISGPLFSGDSERLEFARTKAIEWAAWTDSCRRAWDAHPPELRRMLRYEDLLADPAGELRELCAWLGLERDPGELEEAVRANAFGVGEATGPTEFARAATPGLWRENLSAAEQQVAHEIMGSRLNALGYPV